MLLALGSIALFAMVFYPFGYDQAAFTVGGQMIAREGAVPYRDFIDTKPPVIFYLYAFADILFGANTWGIRLIDIIVQLCTAIILYRLVWDWSESRQLAFITPILYALLIAAQGYWMTAQTEGFAALPLAILIRIFWKLDEDRLLWRSLITGALIALLFFLKFTLIAVMAGFYFYLVFRTDIRARFRWSFSLLSLASFGVFTALTLTALYYAGAWENMVGAIDWVRRYAAQPQEMGGLLDGGFRRKFITELLHSHSVLFTILALIAVFGFAKRSITEPASEFKGFILLMCLCYLFSMAGVLAEQKFFPYHYTRGFVFFIPFVAVGVLVVMRYAAQLISKWKTLGRTQRIVSWSFAAIGLVSALFFSPAVQLYSQSFHWARRTVLNQDRERDVQIRIPSFFAYEQKIVGQYLREVMAPGDELFVWGNSVGIYYYAHRLPTTFVLTNTPFISPWTPQGWRREMMSQLERSDPRYIVIEWGDARVYISGSRYDSYQNMNRWPEFREYVFGRYRETKRIGHFVIYERR